MAKGSAMGLWKGKKGSSVFYKISNSNNGQKQGIRERVYDVSNPKTAAQADQRLKLLPAQRIAGVLREVIERGWQGVEYGAKSRSAFLSKALSMTTGIPYMTKDSDQVIPGKYQLTKGTLPQIVSRFIEDGGTEYPRIGLGVTNGTYQTIGAFSQELLDNNQGLAAGDQLTFIYCYVPDLDISVLEDMDYFWKYESVFLDVNNTAPMSDLFMVYSESDGLLMPTLPIDIAADGAVVAVACVQSRLSETGVYMRSTSKLVVADSISGWFSAASKQKARRSYQNTGANDEPSNGPDWPVDGDTDYNETYQGELVLSGLSGAAASANGKSIAVRRIVSDETLAAVYYKRSPLDNTDCVVTPEGNFISVGETVEDRYSLTVAECAQVSSLPKVLWT